MKVRVTGYRKVVIIDFPVLDERAEVVYQRQQRRTKRTVWVEGAGNGEAD